MEVNGELLVELQNAELDLLKQFTDWCDKHEITYWISYGTALGAVRHNGWIPWDDDIDISMPIDDMKKLEKLWKKNGIKGLFLQNQSTDPNLPCLFFRIRKDGTTSMDSIGKQIPLHWGLSIDIFPVFYAPKNRVFQKIQYKCEQIADKASQYNFYNLNSSKCGKFFHMIKRIVFFRTICIISLLSKNNNLYSLGYIDRDIFEKESIFPLKKIKFENHLFFIPNDYDLFLKKTYGDYMALPPVEERITHDYYLLDLHKDFREYVDYDWNPKK